MTVAEGTKGMKTADPLERNTSETLNACLKWHNKAVFVGMPCISGKDENMKVSLEDKMKVWKEYEEKLLNEENEWSGQLNVEKNEGPCEKMSVKAVVEALNLIKAGKATAPSRIASELLKVGKNDTVKYLAEVADDF